MSIDLPSVRICSRDCDDASVETVRPDSRTYMTASVTSANKIHWRRFACVRRIASITISSVAVRRDEHCHSHGLERRGFRTTRLE